jgi:hypothetical protein
MGKPRSANAGQDATELSDPMCSVGFCPVAMLLTATGQVRPDVVEHLLKAGQEFLLAMKAVIDARSEYGHRSRLEKIVIE